MYSRDKRCACVKTVILATVCSCRAVNMQLTAWVTYVGQQVGHRRRIHTLPLVPGRSARAPVAICCSRGGVARGPNGCGLLACPKLRLHTHVTWRLLAL